MLVIELLNQRKKRADDLGRKAQLHFIDNQKLGIQH